MTTREATRTPLPPSPCVGICTMQGDYCYGCGRTGDEIAAWGTMPAGAQSAVWAELPGRLAAFGFKTFRLAAGPEVVGEFTARTFRETTGRWRVVGPDIEGSVVISADDQRPELREDEDEVVAEFADGRSILLRKHEKVRAFGFSSSEDAPQMDTVVLVLPKGRAQRDLQGRTDHRRGAGLPLPGGFTEVNIETAEPSLFEGLDWPQAKARLTSMATKGGHERLSLNNALGSVSISLADAVLHEAEDGANAPPDVKISRAFVACAIFHADDADWVAAALAP